MCAASFFECRDDLAILLGMFGTGADMGEPERLEQLADGPLMIGDAEPFLDDALKIDPAPAHHTVNDTIRSGLDDF